MRAAAVMVLRVARRVSWGGSTESLWAQSGGQPRRVHLHAPGGRSRGAAPPALEGDELAAERLCERVVVGAEDDGRASAGLLPEDATQTLRRRGGEACR